MNDLWKFDGSYWTWVAGDNIASQVGVYGTKGFADSGNKPGARAYSVCWKDSSGNFWLFGGDGYDYAGNLGYLNDLWKFNGSNWTWVSGDDIKDQAGVYGTKGFADLGNKPGPRQNSACCKSSSGYFWLFGGLGYDFMDKFGGINDLWKFDGNNWIWISGDDTTNQIGVYGTKGITASGNKPGAKSDSVIWIDVSGNLWLFGGGGLLNDLWKFDGNSWTWVSGDNIINQTGVYGTKGTPAYNNKPGARSGVVSWVDSSGNLCLFGGTGYGSSGNNGYLNDLWKYKP